MFEDYNKLYEKCEKIKKPTYKKILKIQEEWNKLSLKYLKNVSINDLTTMWTLLDNELCDNKNYFNNFVSYLYYYSDRMNLNRWCRLQLLLGNAVEELYKLDEEENKQMNKLFDDSIYIDKSIITSYDKKKWQHKFQEYCDSDEIRKESDENGLNACGYYYACDLCDGSDMPYACARATIQYFRDTGRRIDYKNTTKDYLDKILRLEVE